MTIPVEPQPDKPEPAFVMPPRSAHGDWWLLVFIPGLLLSVAAVTWMLQGYEAAGLSWGFWLSFIPFGLGVVLLWLGWEIKQARWFHLVVRQPVGARPSEIHVSFPLPAGLIRWAIRTFGRFGSPVQGQHVSDVLDELDQAVAQDGPVHIAVNEDHGEQVEIWIDGPSN